MLFFNNEELQRIRFLHFKIKKLEEAIDKEEEEYSVDDTNLILEYTMILNINYQNQNQKSILNELDITQTFTDPVDQKEIEIYDIMFECARAVWVLARMYAQISERLEEDSEELENSIIAMLECSKMYKTAAYFSASAVHQFEKGTVLHPSNLELKSEEARGWAQSIVANDEESKENLYFASKLYAGLSALSKRLFYLKTHEETKKQQIRAQFHYDMGKACLLKAKATEESSLVNINIEKIDQLKQKALFYFNKASRIWTKMLDTIKELTPDEKENIKLNVEVVKEYLDEINLEPLEYEKIKRIQDPEPIIMIPENLAPFVPKSTVYLTKIVPKDLNTKRFKKFKGKTIEKKIPYSKKEKLLDKKAGLIRTLNELKVLKENREIDADKFAELMEKYSTKLKMVETALEKMTKKT